MNLREFEKWALTQGSVANPEPDYGFKGQCVSLIQQYLYNVCGIGFKARGHAKDWATNIIEGWDKFDVSNTVKAGDILVYTTGTYGHIVIVNADLQCLEQNKDYKGIITVSPIRAGYSCILRSRQAIDVGTMEQTTKSIVDLANEVIAGKYGNGETRKQALGSLYNEVQAKVNEILRAKNIVSTTTQYRITANGGLWLLDGNGKKIKAYPCGDEVEYIGEGYKKYGYNYVKVKALRDGKVGYMAREYLI
jgi:hypothetical protein